MKRDYNTVILEKKENVAIVTMNRPEKLNALNPQLLQDLRDALLEVDSDPELRVLILTATGRGFCSGIDYAEGFKVSIENMKKPGGDDPTRRFEGMTGPNAIYLNMIRIPVIAAVNGFAVGAGCTMLTHADILIASEEAKFTLRFSKLGLILEYGSTYYLPRIIGIRKAAELAFTARWFDAREAMEIGFVNKVVPHDELMNASWEMAKEIADNSPVCNRFNKRGLYLGMAGSLEHAQMYEGIGTLYVAGLPYLEQTVDAFLEKREPIR